MPRSEASEGRASRRIGWIASMAIGGSAHAPSPIARDVIIDAGCSLTLIREVIELNDGYQRSPQSGITERSKMSTRRLPNPITRSTIAFLLVLILLACASPSPPTPTPVPGRTLESKVAEQVRKESSPAIAQRPASSPALPATSSDQHARACGCTNFSDCYAATHHHADTHTVHR